MKTISEATNAITRRQFARTLATAGAGLVIGFQLPLARRSTFAAEPAKPFAPNAWIRIGTDNVVTILVDKSEMGQGIYTALPMIVAEELELDWSTIRVEPAPVDPVYNNPFIGQQATGGSTSVRTGFDPLRKAGATAREMLIAAAAQQWGVNRESCCARDGAVIEKSTGKKLTYGELAAVATKLSSPTDVKLKEPKDWRVLGKSRPRIDTPAKTDGSAVFGIDVKVPGLLVTTVARCPVFGGKVKSFNATDAKKVVGVRHVVQIEGGVAVVADGYWAAKKGREALQIQWDEGSNAELSSASILETFKKMAEEPGALARAEGNAEFELKNASRKVEAVYQVPFLAHATMEPMNCTAHVRKDGCDVWAPTQAQTMSRATAARITGLSESAIAVHTTLLGGGFGRRFEQDFVADAVGISKLVGAPVKVIWSREDDMQHDFYRPATYNRLAAGVRSDGSPIAWTHRIVGPSILSRVHPPSMKNGIDPTAVEGAANLPYAIPNIRVDYVLKDVGVPVGFWRSVGSSQNAFITECFLDELAAKASKDPFEFRRHLLRKAPRHKAVLELAAEKAGWNTAAPKGRFRGIAVHESFGSYVAQVAEISLSDAGAVRVHRVVCAVDCGLVMNPDTVIAQMESGIVFGLTATLKGEITLAKGRVQQIGFDHYELLRIDEMPVIEVHIIRSTELPGGVGEPGTPPIAPAVCNAIFAATGKRVRELPIRKMDLSAVRET